MMECKYCLEEERQRKISEQQSLEHKSEPEGQPETGPIEPVNKPPNIPEIPQAMAQDKSEVPKWKKRPGFLKGN